MPHERITSNDVAGDITVHWGDGDMVVAVGMIWDDPAADDGPRVVAVNAPHAPDTRNAAGVVERRVEHGPGGAIAVPIATYDAAHPDGPAGEPPVRAFIDEQGRWSIYLQLDRPKVNRMIRALRRARNKAFGEDE